MTDKIVEMIIEKAMENTSSLSFNAKIHSVYMDIMLKLMTIMADNRERRKKDEDISSQ